MEFTSNDKIYTGVHGQTLIDHRIRRKLNLSMEEYAVCMFIHEAHKQDGETTWKKLGIRYLKFRTVASELNVKGILQIIKNLNRNEQIYRLFDVWNNEFPDTEQEFLEFYELFRVNGKIKGNKENARRCYIRSRKIAEKEILFEAAKKYVSNVEDPTYIMHPATWLHPDKKHWEDELITNDKKNGKEKLTDLKRAAFSIIQEGND